MTRTDYWIECLESTFDEHGIEATPEQIAAVATDIEGARENMSMAFPVPESPYPGEIKRLQAEVATERSKVVCPECKGSGSYFHPGPYHSSSGACFKCHGEGKVLP